MLRGTDRNTNNGCWLSSVPLKKLDLDLLQHHFRDSLARWRFFYIGAEYNFLSILVRNHHVFLIFLATFRFLCFNLHMKLEIFHFKSLS